MPALAPSAGALRRIGSRDYKGPGAGVSRPRNAEGGEQSTRGPRVAVRQEDLGEGVCDQREWGAVGPRTCAGWCA